MVKKGKMTAADNICFLKEKSKEELFSGIV